MLLNSGCSTSIEGQPASLTKGGPCRLANGTGCSPDEVCVDDPRDYCNPKVTEGCPGLCTGIYHAPPCDDASGTGCLDGFSCVPSPGNDGVADKVSMCVRGELAACETDDDCAEGFLCTSTGDDAHCLPERVSCELDPMCNAATPPRCPTGYAIAAETDDLCVPAGRCVCGEDSDCPAWTVCDRVRGVCSVLRAPEPRCLEEVPWAAMPGPGLNFYFSEGRCQVLLDNAGYTSGNWFLTYGACLAACEGRPREYPCPAGTVSTFTYFPSRIDSCGIYGEFCLDTCSDEMPTCGLESHCVDGLCQLQ